MKAAEGKGSCKTGLLTIISIILTLAVIIAAFVLYNEIKESKNLSDDPASESPAAEQTVSVELVDDRVPTLKSFLKNALMPVGETMYVYGGGWNEEDTGAGIEAVTIGLSPEWKRFYAMQDSAYNSSDYRYHIHEGLDCSGYIGWVVYNTLETENGREGYVYPAQDFAEKLAEQGLGTKINKEEVSAYCPGDIMSSRSDHHVWISLGGCSDGSVVLVHSSPPGVRLCGTAAADGYADSEAVHIAERFMQRFYPEWYEKFPDCSKNASYLTNYDQFRWNISESGVMSDKEGFSELTPEEILTELLY